MHEESIEETIGLWKQLKQLWKQLDGASVSRSLATSETIGRSQDKQLWGNNWGKTDTLINTNKQLLSSIHSIITSKIQSIYTQKTSTNNNLRLIARVKDRPDYYEKLVKQFIEHIR